MTKREATALAKRVQKKLKISVYLLQENNGDFVLSRKANGNGWDLIGWAEDIVERDGRFFNLGYEIKA